MMICKCISDYFMPPTLASTSLLLATSIYEHSLLKFADGTLKLPQIPQKTMSKHPARNTFLVHYNFPTVCGHSWFTSTLFVEGQEDF